MDEELQVTSACISLCELKPPNTSSTRRASPFTALLLSYIKKKNLKASSNFKTPECFLSLGQHFQFLDNQIQL